MLVFLFLVQDALRKQLLLEPLVSNSPAITQPNLKANASGRETVL